MSKNFVSNSDAQALMQAIEAKKLTVSDTMPAASPALIGNTRLYIGSDTASLSKGGVYQCQALEVTPAGSEDPQSEGWYIYNSVDDEYELTTDTSVVAGTTYYTIEWKNISRAEVDLSHYKKIWGGSTAAWEQLTDAEKEEYDYEFFDDDQSEYSLEIVDAVTKGDMHPVTSNAVAEEIDAIDAETSDIVNIYGSKNLLLFDIENIKAINTSGTWSGNSYTYLGITYTLALNDDGTLAYVEANGTANTNAQAQFHFMRESLGKKVYMPEGHILMSGCPSGGSDAGFSQVLYYNGAWYVDIGLSSGKDINIADPTKAVDFYINIKNGTTVDHQRYYPMLRRSSIKDGSYVPYAMTNKEITQDIAHIENVIAPIDSSATITTLLEQLTTTNSKVTFNSSSRYIIGHVEILNLVFDMSSAADGDIIFTGLGACFDTTYFKPADASGINIFRDTNGNVIIQYAAGAALSIRGQLISILS